MAQRPWKLPHSVLGQCYLQEMRTKTAMLPAKQLIHTEHCSRAVTLQRVSQGLCSSVRRWEVLSELALSAVSTESSPSAADSQSSGLWGRRCGFREWGGYKWARVRPEVGEAARSQVPGFRLEAKWAWPLSVAGRGISLDTQQHFC